MKPLPKEQDSQTTGGDASASSKTQSRGKHVKRTSRKCDIQTLLSQLEQATRTPLASELILCEKYQASQRATLSLTASTTRPRKGNAPTKDSQQTSSSSPSKSPGKKQDSTGTSADASSSTPLSLAKTKPPFRGGPTLPPRPSPTSAAATTQRARPESRQSPSKPTNHPEKTWQQLLSSAVPLVPYMTDQQHGHLLHLTSILLLGFFLPHSTGNDFALLQQPRQGRHPTTTTLNPSSNKPLFDPTLFVLQMPLEERLEKSIKRWNGNEFSEPFVLTDTSWELALDAFLCRGVAPLLRKRPFPSRGVDLLHVLAMAIHSQPVASDMIPHVYRYLQRHSTPSWIKTQHLMQSLTASQFHVHYMNRLQVVVLIADHLILEELEESSPDATEALLHGGIPHLRASLRAFARSALSVVHGHVAYCALVQIACQTQNKRILEEEWNYLLHTTVEDHVIDDCGCATRTCSGRRKRRVLIPSHHLKVLETNEPFCLHTARGELLSEFIIQCFRSKVDMRNPALLQRIASSLTDAIEWQVDCWSKDDDKAESNDAKEDDAPKQLHPPCLLKALLTAATSLFDFLPETTTFNDDDPVETLTESAIQLLRHADTGIANAAADVVVVSLSLRFREDSLPPLLESCKSVLQDKSRRVDLSQVVALVSQKSAAFAYSLLVFLMDCTEGKQASEERIYRSISTVSSNCPKAAAKAADGLGRCLKASPENYKLHVAASILALRQARYFVTGANKVEAEASRVVLDVTSPWDMYKMAGYLMQVGNFELACQIYDKLLHRAHDEKHFLWISSLGCVADAEFCLAKNGAKGIPHASTELRSAVSFLQSIERIFGTACECYGFQVCFLLLRLDFLDLLTILRQLTREMRLTGKGPSKYTRPFVHLRSVIRSFKTLSTRYTELAQRNGIRFLTGRSRAMLQIAQSSCRFLACAAEAVFVDFLPPAASDDADQDYSGENSHPLSSLITRLNELMVKPMKSTAVDPIVRAAAMEELLDGILMTPVPFPKDFLRPSPGLVTTIHFFTPVAEAGQDVNEQRPSAMNVFPGLCFTVCCGGHVPDTLIREARRACCIINVSFRFLYEGPLDDDDLDETKGEHEGGTSGRNKGSSRVAIEEKLKNLAGNQCAPLLCDGTFFVRIESRPILEEGHYTMELDIGCRDVSGVSWRLIAPEHSRSIQVDVTRAV